MIIVRVHSGAITEFLTSLPITAVRPGEEPNPEFGVIDDFTPRFVCRPWPLVADEPTN